MNPTLSLEIKLWLKTHSIPEEVLVEILTKIFEQLDRSLYHKYTRTLQEVWEMTELP